MQALIETAGLDAWNRIIFPIFLNKFSDFKSPNQKP